MKTQVVLLGFLACACTALALQYPVELFPRGSNTAFTIQPMIDGNLFVAGLGVDGQIWRVYQVNGTAWSEWAPLTKNCPSFNDTNRPCIFNSDPVLGRNPDGRLELFVRFETNLDVWQMYMLDANDPNSWNVPRESSCVDQAQDTGIWYCFCPQGQPKNQCTYPSPNYWNTQPLFPTSDLTILNSAIDNRIQIFYRGFEGHLYMSQQAKAGVSDLYLPPVMLAKDTLFV